MEFFYFKGPDDPTPLDQAGYFDLTHDETEARAMAQRGYRLTAGHLDQAW